MAGPPSQASRGRPSPTSEKMIAARLEKKEIVEARRRKLRKSGFFTKLCYGCIGLTASVIALIIIISGQEQRQRGRDGHERNLQE